MANFLRSSKVILLFFIALQVHVYAQNGIVRPESESPQHCGSDYSHPVSAKAQRLAYDKTAPSNKHRFTDEATDTAHYTLPIAVHIIHQNGAENISDEEVRASIRLLNDAFARVTPFDGPQAVSTQIKFCLSTRTPTGSLETAITRHESPLTTVVMENDDEALKALVNWNPSAYINVWVVNSISSLHMGSGVAGYAMMPYMHGSAVDGIVIEADFMRGTPDEVKVLVHEVGHYLGLYHTFEGGCKNDDCTMDGDRVCDTPPDNSKAAVLCQNSVNTCHTDEHDTSLNNPFRAVNLGGSGDQPDMIQNYMDYGFSECQHTFTQGQRRRMRDAITEIRHSLLEGTPRCADCGNVAQVSWNVPDSVEAGVPITFRLIPEDPGVPVLWLIDGGAEVTTTVTQTFDTQKEIQVMALINYTNSNCRLDLKKSIFVSCDIEVPTFTTDPNDLVSEGETVHFETNAAANSYTWKIDGISTATGTSFDYTVVGAEGRLVTLEVSNGTCKRSSAPYFLEPGNCKDSKENNIWYFGSGGGIDFNQHPPRPIMGKINTEEGCAVFCDPDGTPVYHSDGAAVGNSLTGAVLLNGNGLRGSFTTTQSALFVPQPGNDRFVFLFSLDYQAGDGASTGGLYYSIIDRDGNNGQGEVIVKNILMRAPMVEKLTAVKNLKGDGIWVIAHEWNSNGFFAWPVTQSGVGIPVSSYVGAVHSTKADFVLRQALGELKSSPSGKLLASVINSKGLFEVFDFDNASGKISNPRSFSNANTSSMYGLSFSPNERYLYGSSIGPFRIIRFDLKAGSEVDINNSVQVISEASGNGGALQLAPDGRIYAARKGSNYLSVIGNPNAQQVNDCAFERDGFHLHEFTISEYGLPNPVQSVLSSVRPTIVGPQRICLKNTDTTVTYSFSKIGRATYSWTHKGLNSVSVLNDSSISLHAAHSGTDTIVLKRSAPCADLFDTLLVSTGTPLSFELGTDRMICKDAQTVITGPPGFSEYQWSNNTNRTNATYSNAGKVTLTAITASGCKSVDSLFISFYALPELNLGRDTSLCDTEELLLSAPSGMNSYSWSTGENALSITVQDSGSYVATVGKYGCLFSDTLVVWKNTPQNILSSDTTLISCLGTTRTIAAPDGLDEYHWKLPSGEIVSERTILPEESGMYLLTYSNRCGFSTDSIYCYKPLAVTTDFFETCDDTLTLVSALMVASVTGGSTDEPTYYSQDGDTIRFFRSGTYSLITVYDPEGFSCLIRNRLTILVDSMHTQPARSIDLGNDTSYCEGKILPLDAGVGFDSYRWNTGSTERQITVFGFGTYSVTAEYCSYRFSDTIHVAQDQTLDVNLGADRVLCASEEIILNAGDLFDFYKWNTGEESDQITVSTSGRYFVMAGLNGCIAQDTISISNGSISLTISGDTLLCQNETIQLSATNVPGMLYAWDSLSYTASNTSRYLSVAHPGIYKVSSASCASSWSDDIEITRENIVLPSYYFTPDSVCSAQDSISIHFAESEYEFTWPDGSHLRNKKFLPSSVLTLSVKGKKCASTFSINIPEKPIKNCSITGTPSTPACIQNLLLLPNPGTDWVELMLPCNESDGRMKASLINAEGKIIVVEENTLNGINDMLNTRMGTMGSGMYVIKLEIGNEIRFMKWMIAK